MKFKRTSVVLALAAVALMAITPIASAQETDGGPDVAGKGWLKARGTGNATIDMGGKIRVFIDGDVAITNLGDRFQVKLRTDRARAYVTESVGPDVLLQDFTGWLVVKGNHFLIEMEGSMKFKAKGKGAAYLEGNGIYKTRRGHPHRWDPAGLEVRIGPAESA
ncbi:MAG: hypothetical protein HKN91_16690 [Acidimicrobiia bacterium]|nr:hypothetical protein [Acidimicrobiia bacterium]